MALLHGAVTVVTCATSAAGGTSWNQVWLIATVAAGVATVLASATLAVLPLDRLGKHEPRAKGQMSPAMAST